MLKCGITTDNRCLGHNTGVGHPERSDRIRSCLVAIEQANLNLVPVESVPINEEKLAYVHAKEHIDRVYKHCQTEDPLEYDTPVAKDSYQVALLSVAAAISLSESVIDKTIDNGFSLMRPPGHHATAFRAMGFCLFNSVAIATRHLQKKHGLDRIAIIDWDVHHGNGTQDIFYSDPSVFYFSIHQSPLYPGTGLVKEKGTGRGVGKTLNCPMPPYSGDSDYTEKFRKVLQPQLTEFKPEFIFISAGFDAHERDPLSQMNMTSEGFADLTKIVQEIADQVCRGHIVSVLEGGYDLQGLSTSVVAHLRQLSNQAE